MKYLVVGGDLDGQRFTDEKTTDNPVCNSPWYYTKRTMSIEREDGNKEEFILFTPQLLSHGDCIKLLIEGYRVPKQKTADSF